MRDPDERDGPDDLDDGVSAAYELEYEEPPLNHLSPMGQVEAVGRLARGLGPDRLRRIVRIGIAIGMIAIVAALLVG